MLATQGFPRDDPPMYKEFNLHQDYMGVVGHNDVEYDISDPVE